MAYFSDYQQGDSGQGVTDLQNALQSVGYPIGVDGQFGRETAAAVEHFQNARGVTDDVAGVAGPGTLIALATAKGEGWQQSGFFYLALPRGFPSKPVTPAASAGGSSSAPAGGGMSDKTKLVLGGAAVLGLAWFFTSRR